MTKPLSEERVRREAAQDSFRKTVLNMLEGAIGAHEGGGGWPADGFGADVARLLEKHGRASITHNGDTIYVWPEGDRRG